MKRACVVLSGQVLDDAVVRDYLTHCDVLLCADGGARHLRRMDLLPSLLVGDLDSIDPQDLKWIQDCQVPIQRFPAVKDETDAELAIQIALERLDQLAHGVMRTDRLQLAPACSSDRAHELVLVAALGGRPDHVLASQLLAIRLATSGIRVVLTDGASHIYAMSGPDQIAIDLPALPGWTPAQQWAISAIPVSSVVSGLTYTGLDYPLDRATLTLGSSRGVSNRPQSSRSVDLEQLASNRPDSQGQLVPGLTDNQKKPPSITVQLDSGSILLMITPAV